MSNSDVADQGQKIRGRVVNVKPQGDGTVFFRVTCHNSRGRVAHGVNLFLPPNSEFVSALRIAKGGLATVYFESTGKARDRATSVQI